MSFGETGFLVVPPRLPLAMYDQVREDYERLTHDGAMKSQDAFHYGGPPRGWEMWKRSAAAREVAWSVAEGAEPFQTLHFKRGSTQPLHQDHAHFDTVPEGRMFAAWTALEDITPESGPLVVLPGSHLLPAVDLWKLGLPPAEHGVKDPAYGDYEKWVATVGQAYEVRPLLLKKGESVVFGGRLLHGGSPIMDPYATRWSQVTHYAIPPYEYAYAPMLSSEADHKKKDMAAKNFRDPRNWEAH